MGKKSITGRAAQSGVNEAKGTRRAGKARRKFPRNHRELAQEIFAQCDVVQLGRELLESGNKRGSTVRARVWETLTNWLYGEAEAATRDNAPEQTEVQIIWDIPGPSRDSESS